MGPRPAPSIGGPRDLPPSFAEPSSLRVPSTGAPSSLDFQLVLSSSCRRYVFAARSLSIRSTFQQFAVVRFVSLSKLISLMMSVQGDAGGEAVEERHLVHDAKRQRTSLDSMKVVMAAQYIQQHLPNIEPFLRRVVQEEVENAIWRNVHFSPRAPLNKIQASVNNQYSLLFQNSLPGTLFTSSKIEAEGQEPVEIVLVDSQTRQIITHGPLSSIKVEVLVLDGDFGVDGQEEWTEKEFNDSIVREREGKRPLLSGELMVTLNKGLGRLGDANFTDNSSWTRSRRFRLGARVCQNKFRQRVQEALSGSFLVKDHRGELYKKHHPPSLEDDVWRLEKIGKDGVFHKRLAEYRIVTVQDFLKNFVMDPDKLRQMLGTGMSNKMWDATVEHAKKCIIPHEKLYSYNCSQGLVLVFNAINELLGAIIQDKLYRLDELPPTEKLLIHKLKQDAYASQDRIIEIIRPLASNFQRLLSPDSLTLQAVSFDEHIPCTSLGNHDDQILNTNPLRLPNLKGDSTMHELYQTINTFSGTGPAQAQGSCSFQLDSNPRCYHNMPLINYETGSFAEPVIPEVHMLRPSQFPVLWDQPSDLVHVPDARKCKICASHAPRFGAHIFSSKWVKLKAVSRLMAIARRSSRRAAFMKPAYPVVSSSMYDDTYGELAVLLRGNTA
ncbi:calmodulin-binding protein 60 A-like isoform X2 [Zingiber officinale]|uniref:calmodulin-binding protein 60 A-like isoform X2 n=1 Tax=Zingiber officinale TaxID=94328 RepID=UPI001C4CC6B6|nr:calmodulin-binding protein 60 A-like isoform X2 [Zingiber officinale]